MKKMFIQISFDYGKKFYFYEIGDLELLLNKSLMCQISLGITRRGP